MGKDSHFTGKKDRVFVRGIQERQRRWHGRKPG
jgi:hypothetical protein